VNSLTEEEIKAVEHGEANVNYQHVSSIQGRIHEILWEIELYKRTGDANGHSLTQRFEYWKTACIIIKNNFFIGVGSGDVDDAFRKQYEESDSALLPKWRLRAHNQYLSIAVGMGIIGLMWFLITLFYPVTKHELTFNYLYITFFIIAMVSFLTEDTLETQAGVTFFAFFNSFFLFLQPKKTKET
jgi:O-antigen ligase